MKIKLLVAAAATVVASGAMAQSAFDGFYGQASTGYENNTFSSTQLVVGPNSMHTGGRSDGSNTATAAGAPLVLGLGYNMTVAPKISVGLGVDYSAISMTTGNQNFNFGAGNGTAAVQYKVSNRYNIFLAPGYQIDKDKLAYIKVGYSNETIQPSANGSPGVNFNNTTLSGYVVGLGYKQIISGGFYGFGEVNVYGYNNANISGSTSNNDGSGRQGLTANPSTSAYNALVGVGYKF